MLCYVLRIFRQSIPTYVALRIYAEVTVFKMMKILDSVYGVWKMGSVPEVASIAFHRFLCVISVNILREPEYYGPSSHPIVRALPSHLLVLPYRITLLVTSSLVL